MHLGWDMGEIARLELVELYVFEVEFAQRHLGLDRGGSVQVKLAAFEVEPQALGLGRGMFVQLEVVEQYAERSLHCGQAAVALVMMR